MRVQRAEPLARIFQLVASGTSFQVVARQVVEEGLVPEHRITYFTRPGAPGRVHRIVRDVFYRGEFDWGGESYQGNHKPLLMRVQWEAAQPENTKSNQVRKWKRDSALAGLLSCAECGCRITYDPKTKKSGKVYPYYRCSNGKKQHQRLNYVKEADIFAEFEGAIDALLFEPDWFELLREELNTQHRQHKEARRAQMQRFKACFGNLQDREDLLYDDRVSGVLDEDGCRRQLDRIRLDRARLTEGLQQANEEDDDRFLVNAQRTLELARGARNAWDGASPKEERRLLKILVSNPRLRGRTVGYSLRKPFQILSEMARRDEWRTP